MATIALASCASQADQQFSKTDYVDPFIGTGFHGHTFPGPTMPFGMVQLSPDTHIMGWDASSGYHYGDSLIYAFSHTHLSGTGIGDLGDVALLPYSGAGEVKPVGAFDKSSEVAKPGYYKVDLKNYGVKAELTATNRVGFHRYTYNDPAERRVMLDLGHVLQPNWGHKVLENHINVENNQTISGTAVTQGWAHRQTVSYRIEFAEPFDSLKLYKNGIEEVANLPLIETSDADLKLHMKFANLDQPVLVKVAISPVDEAGAAKNMREEVIHWEFDRLAADAQHQWEHSLNKIQIETNDESVRKNFYTALYHTMIAPNQYQDVDGRYIGMDKQVHTATNGYTNYTVFSLWDTFRTMHPLMTIINPEQAKAWGEVMVKAYDEGGIMPRWPLYANYTGCMVGYPAVSLLADLAAKDMAPANLDKWVEASQQTAIYRPDMVEKLKGTREVEIMTMHPYYKEKYGFVPADSIAESVSWGLEMAYYDWCVAQLAKAAGNTAIADEFGKKGDYWKRYFDPSTGFMRGVMGDGSFREPFNPRYSAHMKSDYVEGNAFQWSYFVPHDVEGMIELHGGKNKFEAALDTLFTTSSHIDGEEASADITGLIGQYAHGNEPSHHMAYLYNWTDAPYKAQERLDQIMRDFYLNEPAGIIGNEDCGQMSAWYVMSALGFYQVCPGEAVYTIGRPMVDRAVIPVADGKKQFEIIVHDNSPENMYVKEVKLNGKTLESPFFTHKDIVAGGKLEFFMSPTHN